MSRAASSVTFGAGRRRRRSSAVTAAAATTLLLAGQLIGSSHAYAAEAVVSLGSAGTYSVLGAAVTVDSATRLSGDLGVSPGNALTGVTTGVVGGTIHAGDDSAAQARADLELAYADAASRTPTGTFAGDLKGQTFSAGVYHTDSAMALTGVLTLDGGGDPNAVFIFQVNAALNTEAASTVVLKNGAVAANVFWQVNGAAGTGARATFSGTILAFGAITLGAGTVLDGRALGYAAVTLAANTVLTPAVSAGTLSISVPGGVVDLGTHANIVSGETVSGSLGPVQVSDTRAALAAGWVVSVTATAFTPGTGTPIPPSAVSYSAGPITAVSGTATYTTTDRGDLTAAVPVVTAVRTAGDNIASWNPIIVVSVPGGIAVGVYTSTIVHSVL